MKTILVLNTGSSSVKASLYSIGSNAEEPKKILTAHGEKMNKEDSFINISILTSFIESIQRKDASKNSLHRSNSLQLTSRATHRQEDQDENESNVKKLLITEPNLSHKQAILSIINSMKEVCPNVIESVVAVGHRVVHGGDLFSDSTEVNDEILEQISSVSHLAPLHNPANIEGIKVAREIFNDNVKNVAVFDTAFHSTMPPYAYNYPLPKEYRESKIRKYGFHGTSVKYVSQEASKILKNMNRSSKKMIIAHLGSGASVTAVVDGRSIDTTMGFSPLSGIMMGTRSGDVDPSIIPYAKKKWDKSDQDVMNDLNKKSGLMGISDGYNDMRCVTERAAKGDSNALLALEMFTYILSKHIAGLLISCGGEINALVFTAGIGEHSACIRRLTIQRLSVLLGGLKVDEDKNEANGTKSNGIISCEDEENINRCVALVVPTDEEKMICEESEIFLA